MLLIFYEFLTSVVGLKSLLIVNTKSREWAIMHRAVHKFRTEWKMLLYIVFDALTDIHMYVCIMVLDQNTPMARKTFFFWGGGGHVGGRRDTKFSVFFKGGAEKFLKQLRRNRCFFQHRSPPPLVVINDASLMSHVPDNYFIL